MTDLIARDGLSANRGKAMMDSIAVLSLGVGLAILGVAGLTSGDFALQWQPVPGGVTGRSTIAYFCASIELLTGLFLLMGRMRRLAMCVAILLFIMWIALLHLPRVVAAPTNLVDWLGLAEISFIGLGALILAGYGWTQRPAWSLTIRFLCGLALIVFGSTHFVFAEFTAQMIPSWLPFPAFWAYLTGFGHAATGLVLISGSVLLAAGLLLAPIADGFAARLLTRLGGELTGVVIRISTLMFALMISSFVLFLHVPRVAAMIDNRAEWTMLAIALCIQAGAWAMAARFGTERDKEMARDG